MGKAARVDWCLDLMSKFQWHSPGSLVEGAERFGVAVKTMQADAAEASRRTEGLSMTDGELRAKIESGFAYCIKETSEAIAAMKTEKDYRGVARAGESMGKNLAALAGLRGLDAPKKHQIEGTLADLLANITESETKE